MLVCANHLRAAMFIDHGNVDGAGGLTHFFYLLTGLGAQAVVVFFVLSGLFVGGAVINRWHDFNAMEYAINRVVRLWVVLVPSLVLTYVVDGYAMAMAPDVLFGADSAVLSSGPTGHYSVSLQTLIQNLLFLQTITGPVFGSNDPLWSLSNEFWYYVFFPILVYLYWAPAGLLLKLPLSLLLCVVFWMQADKLPGLLVWVMGAVVVRLPSESIAMRSKLWVVLVVAAFGGALISSKLQIFGYALSMVLLGASSALLIKTILLVRDLSGYVARFAHWLSNISFSLYLLHFPLVMLLYIKYFRGHQLTPSAQNIVLYMGIIVIMLAATQIFWFCFERNTQLMRGRLLSLLSTRLQT